MDENISLVGMGTNVSSRRLASKRLLGGWTWPAFTASITSPSTLGRITQVKSQSLCILQIIVTVVSNKHHVYTLCIYMIPIWFYKFTKSVCWFIKNFLFLGEIQTQTFHLFALMVKKGKQSNCFNESNEYPH